MRENFGQTFIMFLGFFAGVALAFAIAPGDVLLWIAAGIVLALFCGAFFAGNTAGSLFWPFKKSFWSRSGSSRRTTPR